MLLLLFCALLLLALTAVFIARRIPTEGHLVLESLGTSVDLQYWGECPECHLVIDNELVQVDIDPYRIGEKMLLVENSLNRITVFEGRQIVFRGKFLRLDRPHPYEGSRVSIFFWRD